MLRTLLTAISLTLFSQTAWAEDASSPKLNDYHKKLESIENRLTNLEKRIPEASGIETFAKMIESLNSIGSSASNKVAITKNEERKVAGSDFLSIVSWSAKEEKSNGYSLGAILNLEYSVKNVSDKAIVLVDGAITFEDKLGQRIARIQLDNDLRIQPSEIIVQKGKYDTGMSISGDPSRLASVSPNLVLAEVDLDQIMFEDGTIIKFD